MTKIHFASFDTQLYAPAYNTPFNVTMLGGGKNKEKFWQKHYQYHKFSSRQPANDLIVFFDARDVIFVGENNEDIILSRFNNINANIVIGAEFGCFPAQSICHTRPLLFPDPLKKYTPDFVRCDWTCTSQPGYKFLNSGFIMGRAKYLTELWIYTNYMNINRYSYDDQRALNEVYAYYRHKLNIMLDYDANLVLNMQRMTDDSLLYRSNKLYSILFNHSLLFLHGNGNGKNKIRMIANKRMQSLV